MNMSASRISDPNSSYQPFTAWVAGLVLTMLAVAVYGAVQPLLPPEPPQLNIGSDEIAVIDFQAPDEAPAKDGGTQPEEPAPEIEIPPLPEIIPPLTPHDVPELIASEKPPPPVTPPATVPKPKKENPPPQKPASRAPAATGPSSGEVSNPTPALMTGIGSGRFPSPSYPASARAANQQGTVRLMITVEASGVASSVDILSPSGSDTLDRAALDHIRRRWRWPSGPVRKYVVPVRFEIK